MFEVTIVELVVELTKVHALCESGKRDDLTLASSLRPLVVGEAK